MGKSNGVNKIFIKAKDITDGQIYMDSSGYGLFKNNIVLGFVNKMWIENIYEGPIENGYRPMYLGRFREWLELNKADLEEFIYEDLVNVLEKMAYNPNIIFIFETQYEVH